MELNQEEASIIYLNLSDQNKKRLIHDQCILKRLKKKNQRSSGTSGFFF